MVGECIGWNGKCLKINFTRGLIIQLCKETPWWNSHSKLFIRERFRQMSLSHLDVTQGKILTIDNLKKHKTILVVLYVQNKWVQLITLFYIVLISRELWSLFIFTGDFLG